MCIDDPQQNISVKITFYFNILKQSILDFFWELPTHSPAPSQSSQDPRWVTKIAPKKLKTSVWLFQPWFLPPPLSQSSQDSRWVMKIVPKKLKTSVDFFQRDFCHPTTHTLLPHPPPYRNHCKTLDGWRKSRQKIENIGLIFSATIVIPPPIAIITGPSNSQYWIFKHFWEFTHGNIEFASHAITMGGGMKITPEKIGNVCRMLKNYLKCGRDKSPGQVDRHQAELLHQFDRATCSVDAPLYIAS